MKEKILVSGVKPTGTVHLGNYFGAMKQFVDLQDAHTPLVFIANYHALTTVQDAKVLSRASLDVALDYLAIGIDPDKTTLFLQSDVPEVTELAWIFNNLVTMPYLMRAHAFKDKEAKSAEVNVGLFDYPVLMAADILMYGAHVVPVGQDQKQHIEMTRDIAEKFNRIFAHVFRLPEPMILEEVKTVPGTDGQKMSKSYGNIIPLFAEREELQKIIAGIVTDSKKPEEPKEPETSNIFQIHKLFLSEEEAAQLALRYKKGGLSYKEAKELLFEDADTFIAPLREKRKKLAENEDEVIKILKDGGAKAREIARDTMSRVHKAVGII